MARYRIPNCVMEFPDGSICNRPMEVLGERHPAFGPNWRPGHWVFRCRYCQAIQAISDKDTNRYAVRTRG